MENDYHNLALSHVCGICLTLIVGKCHKTEDVCELFEQIFTSEKENGAPHICGACAWKLNNLNQKAKKWRKRPESLRINLLPGFPSSLPIVAHTPDDLGGCVVCQLFKDHENQLQIPECAPGGKSLGFCLGK